MFLIKGEKTVPSTVGFTALKLDSREFVLFVLTDCLMQQYIHHSGEGTRSIVDIEDGKQFSERNQSGPVK